MQYYLSSGPEFLAVRRVVVDVGVPARVRVERGAVHQLAAPAALQRHAQQRRRHLRRGAPPAARRRRLRRRALRSAHRYTPGMAVRPTVRRVASYTVIIHHCIWSL